MVVANAVRGISQSVNWWAIILPFVFVLLFFGIIILFANKRFRNRFLRYKHGNQALDVNIIKDNHFVISGVVNMALGEFVHNDMTYLIKEKAIYYEKGRIGTQKPICWYIENNPEPMMFDFSSKSAKFTGIDLTKWTQSKLVQMLLDTNIEKFLMIILVLCIVIAIVVALSGGANYIQSTKILETIQMINQTVMKRI
jgi:hypothetical protein